MTESTSDELAEDIIALLKDITHRHADMRTNQMFGIPTLHILQEIDVKLGVLVDGFGDLAESLEAGN
jgi:hypothetical protein